jgi:hydrogenase-4 component E
MVYSPILTLSLALLIAGMAAAELRNLKASTVAYFVHSVFLAWVFAAFAAVERNPSLYWWALTAVVTKMGVIPTLLWVYLRHHPQDEVRPIAGFRLSLAVLSVVLLAFYHLVHTYVEFVAPTEAATLEPARSNLAVAFTVFALGLYVLLTRRDAVKTVIGLCLLENGVHLSLVVLAPTLPETTVIGIASNVVVSVAMLLYVTHGIFEQLGTTDTFELTTLRR